MPPSVIVFGKLPDAHANMAECLQIPYIMFLSFTDW